MGLRHVIDFVVAQVHAARSDFMQLGFPNMGAVFIDQSDERPLTPAIGSSQTGGEFQTASAATHDDDFVLCAQFKRSRSARYFQCGKSIDVKCRSQRHPKLSSLYEFTKMRNSHEELHKIAAGLHSRAEVESNHYRQLAGKNETEVLT
jgi:hypothetical protein